MAEGKKYQVQLLYREGPPEGQDFELADVSGRRLPKAEGSPASRMGDTGGESFLFGINHLLETTFTKTQRPVAADTSTLNPCGEMPIITTEVNLILKEEVCDWLEDFGVVYYLDLRPVFSSEPSHIVIFGSRKATAFKLTWG